jgi:hypothetical protein
MEWTRHYSVFGFQLAFSQAPKQAVNRPPAETVQVNIVGLQHICMSKCSTPATSKQSRLRMVRVVCYSNHVARLRVATCPQAVR